MGEYKSIAIITCNLKCRYCDCFKLLINKNIEIFLVSNVNWKLEKIV